MRAARAALLAVWPLAVAAQDATQDVGPLPRADIFVLGEVHDNPAHHAVQAAIVAEVAPTALIFEMLDAEQAAAGMAVDRDDPEALAEAFGWAESGWPDFAMYAPILVAAPEARIVGAAVGREALMAAMENGAAGQTEAAVPDLTPAQIETLTQDQAEAHCGALPEEMLPGMVEAQRLRDAAFGAAAVAAFEAQGGPVVLITGTGHARTDVGAPATIRAMRPDLVVWSLGQVEGDVPDAAPFDRVVTAAAPEREDPCAVFRN